MGSLSDAVPASEINRQAPRNTKELVPSSVGALVVGLLSQRAQPALAAKTITQYVNDFAENVAKASRDSSESRRRRLRIALKGPSSFSVESNNDNG